MLRQRVRVRFRKEGDLRLISHRDLVCALERLFRRIGVRLSMTEGFHPRARMSFPLSLALGIRGVDELFEVEVDDPPEAEQLLADFQASAPPGLVFTSLEFVPTGMPKMAVAAADYEIGVPAERLGGLPERIAAFLAAESHVIHREHRDQTVDVRAAVEKLELDDAVLRIRLTTSNRGASAKPQEVLAALALDDLLDEGLFFTRTGLVEEQGARK